MMKYKGVKHIAKNMADHRASKDTQNIAGRFNGFVMSVLAVTANLVMYN